MHRIILVPGLLVWLLAACNKEHITAAKGKYYGKGCIERLIIPMNAQSINAADVQTVNALFKNNHINNSNFRYYDYVHDTLQTLYEPFAKLDEKVVRVEQYDNGLRILSCYINYIFLENKLSGVGGELSAGTSLDTKPHLSLDEVRTLFLNNAEEFDGAGNQFKDTCLSAEFGYYNLNAGTSYAPEKLVKAWRVVVKNSEPYSQFPQAYYQDNGTLIYYDNGIRTSK